MNIQEEIRVSEYQRMVMMEDEELNELFNAMVERYNLEHNNCKLFIASLFYNIGKSHGKRAERARRKRIAPAQNTEKLFKLLSGEDDKKIEEIYIFAESYLS